MYQEHRPDIRLTPFVETYWTATEFGDEGEVFKILPDGCVDILFAFGDSSAENSIPHIVGTMTYFIEIKYVDDINRFGIRFKPAGITAFTHVPIFEFTNQQIDMTGVETLFDEGFYEVLPEKKTITETIHHIDTYLLGKLSCLYTPEKQIIHAIDLIYLAKGQLSLADVASHVCSGQRHFERKFKSSVGISPKTFAKIVKFKHTLHHLRTHSSDNLYAIAIDCGYYDQTHLIKDFKALTGDVPGNFR
ncbi:AraC family transcriptional regulator [Bacteroidia bacterium]|nr:AraC family transcriptional regulator [Bacteroidia bacterium]GHU55437.1 AraC family transcriptional regulator [Bacteroidia bacterium]